MLCLRPRRTSAVLPEFDPAMHVITHDGPASDRVREWAAGVDFGFTAPTAILWCAITDDDTIFVMDERIQTETILEDHITAIKRGLARDTIPSWPSVAFIAPTPAGQSRDTAAGVATFQTLTRHGLPTRISRAGILEGLNLIRARLAPATKEPPRLYIHERCKALIESLEKYHYNTKNPDDPSPVKDGSAPAVDALRYLVQVLDKPSQTAQSNYLVNS
jgi:hypothetical protein